jgi:hypothetical protein
MVQGGTLSVPGPLLVMGSGDRDQSGRMVVSELGEGWRLEPVTVGERQELEMEEGVGRHLEREQEWDKEREEKKLSGPGDGPAP